MARATAQRRPMAGLLAAPAVVVSLLRRLRVELPLASSVVGVILITTLIFAAFPRLFNQVSDDGLRYAVRTSQVYERNLVMAQPKRIGASPGDNPFAAVDEEGARFQERLSPSIGSLIDHRTFVVDAARYRFIEVGPSVISKYVTMRYQSGIGDYLQVVQGRMPTTTTEMVPIDNRVQKVAPVVELAMSRQTAEALSVALGDRILLEADPGDQLVRLGRGNVQDIMIDIVGYIEPQRLEDDFWYGDPRLHQASVYDDGTRVQIYSTALFALEAYERILEITNPGLVTYSWRYYTDAERFDAGMLGALASDLRRFDADYASPFTASGTGTTASTRLTAIVNRFAAERRVTEAIISLAGFGLLTVALATIGLVAAFIAERRREMLTLARGRGASARQLFAAQVVEGLLLGIPAALLGYLAATLLIDSRANAWSAFAAGAIVATTTLLLLAAVVPLARRPLRLLERPDVARGRLSARRLALETFVVVLAVAGVYLLRRRGLAGDAATARVGGFDPYLAAVPILVGLATGLAVLRLYVLPIRLLAWNAALRRDLVPFLGFRRITRQSAVTSVPLLVLLLSVAVSVFASVMLNTIETGQVRTAWRRVGADYRVDSFLDNPLYRDVDLSKVEGVESSANAYRRDGVLLVTGGPTIGGLTLFAVEPDLYGAVTRGTPIDSNLPEALLVRQSGPNVGTSGDPIPAIVSRRWITDRPLNVGDVFTLEFQRRRATFVAREIRDEFGALPGRDTFVVTSLPNIQASKEAADVTRNHVYLRASDAAVDQLRETLEAQSQLSTLVSRVEEYESVHGSPLIAGAVSGFRFGIGIAAAYTALAVIVALSLSGRARAHDIAYLRTLGLSSRQVLGLTVAEQAPPVALALIIGTALGIVLAHLIEPGLDLTAFTGPDVPVTLEVSWIAVTLLIAVLVGVVAVAVAAVSLLAGRTNLANVLRLGE